VFRRDMVAEEVVEEEAGVLVEALDEAGGAEEVLVEEDIMVG
jgi:hypothetical protein